MSGHSTRVLRRTSAALLGILLTALPLQARAGEPEGIRLTVDAPPECLVERDLLAQVEALGAHPRAARSEERARAFAVTIAPERDKYSARLVVKDLVGETTERTVTGHRCSDAAKSVALLVALALDDTDSARAQPDDGSPSDSPPAFWPAPARDDTPTAGTRITRVRAGRQGSGGLVVTGIFGPVPREYEGVRAYAAALVSASTRVGASLSFASEKFSGHVVGNTLRDSSGWTGRAGAIIGWGAPWSDTIVGFVGEAGVAMLQQSGVAYRELPRGVWSSSIACTQDGSSSRCFDAERSAPSRFLFFSPFAATSLVLQVPWKAAVRPMVGFTTAVIFNPQVPQLRLTGDLGFVWQAW